LANHLATDNEFSIYLFHEFAGSLKHVDAAVNAGVGASTIPETRISNNVEIIFLLMQHRQTHSQPAGSFGRLILAAGEDGLEVKCFDLDSVSLHDADSELTIQAARQYRNTTHEIPQC
jgi:hypothetical protein